MDSQRKAKQYFKKNFPDLDVRGGQVLNLSSIGNDCGATNNTIKS